MKKESKSQRLARAGEVYLIPVGQVDATEENNFRIDYGDIEALAESIKNAGQRHAVLVKKINGEERYLLKDGYRRMRAIRLLIERGEDVPYVKALMAGKSYSDEDSFFEQIISNDGMPLSQVEQGRVYKVLLERGYSETKIAEKTGKKVSHIRTCIAIASLPMSMQNQISVGTITGNTALEIYKSVDENEGKAVKVLNQSVAEKKEKTGETNVKVKPKDVATIKTKSPIKLMKEAYAIIEKEKVSKSKAALLMKLIDVLENKGGAEEIAALFK
jgi:ParB/RepB/Spo0J family partition protein